MNKNYQSLNPSESKTTHSTISFRTRRSRTSSKSTLQPLPGCLPMEVIRQNWIQASYNRRKQSLRQIEKQNVAMAVRIDNQQSTYRSSKSKSKNLFQPLNMNILNTLNTHKRTVSISWKKANKENLQEIDRILTARDKQIKLLARGKNILA